MGDICLRVILQKYLSSLGRLNCRVNLQYRISHCRKFCSEKPFHDGEKYTVQLLPEVEKLLDSGELKHRKHPGIRKLSPVALPEILRESAYKLISHENEKILLEESESLCNYLNKRRLPVENQEVERRINAMYPGICTGFDGDFEEVHEALNKHQLKIVKKKLASEVARWEPIEYDNQKSLAYLVGRLAPNFASVCHVLNVLKTKVPDFKPKSYFDFGSGVGSALWAAHYHWSDTIKEYFCIDTSTDMNDLCYRLLYDEVTEQKYIEPVNFRQFLPASEHRKYDLVMSAFSLLDLPSASERLSAIDTLWRKTKDYLVIIEYGTVAGFHCVLDARDFILQVENIDSPEFAYYSSGAHVVSPCPHDSPCPKFMEKTNSSCGFRVPYQLLFPQRLSHVPANDWISYVVIKKGQRPNDDSPNPRIVKSVLRRTRHVHCDLCCSDGKIHRIVVTKAKHGRHTYRCTRESEQGDELPVNVMIIKNETNPD